MSVEAAAEASLPDVTAKPTRRLELITAAVALVFAVVLLGLTQGIESNVDVGGLTPRWWPTVLGATSLALSVALLVVAATRPPFERDDLEVTSRTGWARVAITAALSALFLAAWILVGFLVACPVYLAALLAAYGGRGWKSILLFPVLVTAFIYVLFQMLLRVPL